MGKDEVFLGKLFYFATSHPVWSNLTVVFLVAVIQLILELPVKKLLQLLQVENPSNTLVLIASLAISGSIVIFFYWLIYFKNLSKNTFQSYGTGIEKIFPNFSFAKPFIMGMASEKSDNIGEVSILVHSASNLICGNASILGDFIKCIARKSPRDQPIKVRFLIPSATSPYYTDKSRIESRAIERSKEIADPRWSKEEYVERLVRNFTLGVEAMHSALKEFSAYGLANMEIREHDEPYLWNLIFIDDSVFVQGDTFKKALWTAPVLLLKNRNLGASIEDDNLKTYYYTFEKYFEDIWVNKSREIKLL
jgi:hypothetical protein